MKLRARSPARCRTHGCDIGEYLGEASPVSAEEVYAQLGGRIPIDHRWRENAGRRAIHTGGLHGGRIQDFA